MRSSEAFAQPIAMAATSGRVLSKVSITPAKPLATSISAWPSKFAAGTRQLIKLIVAVSDDLIPNLCSSRSTFIPGVPLVTTNDLMADRPSFYPELPKRPLHQHALQRSQNLLTIQNIIITVFGRSGTNRSGI